MQPPKAATMAGGFTYPGNQSSAPIHAIGFSEDPFASSAAASPPTARLGWLAAIFAIVVQQGAFISSPVLSNFVAELGSPDADANILNTLAVLSNIVLIAPFCLLHYRQFLPLIYGNKTAVALMALMLLSVAWSIHPDVTFRRDVNYFSTVLTALYLAGRFDADQIMKIISWGIAISVAFSFLFVAAFPIDAIHQISSGADIDAIVGAWKGVFSHKNVLGHVMSVGVIAELYILTAPTRTRSTIWHVLLLCGCLTLVILSRSNTAMILTSIYILGALLFLLSQRAGQYLSAGLAMLAVLGLTITAIYWAYPNLVFSDPTFTGRTELWELVLRLIWERPFLGSGYSAMWLPSDNNTIEISNAVGWTVPQAHNALLEVTLGMGLVGLAVVIIFVAVSVWRALRCLAVGQHKLGVYSLLFFLGMNISGVTESTLVQNQNIEWVMFNVLSFCCGLKIVRQHADTKL
jgi:exopolysaccharide production protein ExoQ